MTRPLANSSCLVSISVVGCCIYPATPLIASNSTFAGGLPVLSTGFYGTRGNINFGCSSICFPDFLVANSGSTNSFVDGKPKLRFGDAVGNFGGIIIGNPSNNFVS